MRSIVATLPAGTVATFGGLAISPDGRRIVYGIGGALHLRTLDDMEPRPLRGSEGGSYTPSSSAGDRRLVSTQGGGINAVWSPDGREWFYVRMSDQAMMAVPVRTSPTLVVGVKPVRPGTGSAPRCRVAWHHGTASSRCRAASATGWHQDADNGPRQPVKAIAYAVVILGLVYWFGLHLATAE